MGHVLMAKKIKSEVVGYGLRQHSICVTVDYFIITACLIPYTQQFANVYNILFINNEWLTVCINLYVQLTFISTLMINQL